MRHASILVICSFLVQLGGGSVQASLVDGLTNYWDFNHSSGFVLDDSVGSNDGALQGYGASPAWGAGKFGNALSFDGINDEVALGSISATGNTVSIGGWVWLNQLPSAQSAPFHGILDSQNDAFVFYSDQGNQELRFKVTDNTMASARPGIGQNQLSANQWMHIVGTYDGPNNRASIYLNGTLVDQHIGSDTSGPLTGNTILQTAFFGSQGNNWYLQGMLDDFAIWDRVLTNAEIAQLQNDSLGNLMSVPEPSTSLLFAIGLAFSLASPRRRR